MFPNVNVAQNLMDSSPDVRPWQRSSMGLVFLAISASARNTAHSTPSIRILLSLHANAYRPKYPNLNPQRLPATFAEMTTVILRPVMVENNCNDS